VGREPGGGVGDPGRVESVDAGDAVATGDRDVDEDRAAGLHEAPEGVGDVRVEAERAQEQRAPRERNGDEVRRSGEDRVERLRTRGEEERVRGSAAADGPGRATRRLGHRRGGCVDADDERGGVGGGAGEDGPTVAGPEIDDHPLGAGDPLGDLADVCLEGPAADDGTHVEQSSEVVEPYGRAGSTTTVARTRQ
jgi:hypothetical protein